MYDLIDNLELKTNRLKYFLAQNRPNDLTSDIIFSV